MRVEIRIAGTGGMGVVLAGVIVGHAAVVYAGLDAVQTQSYGSEARGTAAKSEVIISDRPIRYPKVRRSDYLIAMSQKALDTYIEGAAPKSNVIIDADLVDGTGLDDMYTVIRVPAMRTAEELGKSMVANMVMLGALAKKIDVLGTEALKKGVADLVPPETVELNLRALRAGAGLV